MYPGDKLVCVRYTHYKCFLPVCGRSFKFSLCIKAIFGVCSLLLGSCLRKHCLPHEHEVLSPVSFSTGFIFYALGLNLIYLEIMFVWGEAELQVNFFHSDST